MDNDYHISDHGFEYVATKPWNCRHISPNGCDNAFNNGIFMVAVKSQL